MSTTHDGSESVDQFLARIASVKGIRDTATEERTKRMEEDFLKTRKERQARRLERARSLSPSKTGPASINLDSPSSITTRDIVLNPPVDFSPRNTTLSRSNAVSARISPKLEPKQVRAEDPPIPNTTLSSIGSSAGLSRSGTLSWQQRPARDIGSSRPRPASTFGQIRAVPKEEDNTNDDGAEPSRQEIAASLGTKDPSWFRQTQERGLGSAAYRKNQVEDTAVVEHESRAQVLPGMQRASPGPSTRTPVNQIVSPAFERGEPVSIQSPKISKLDSSPQASALARSPKPDLSPQQSIHVEPKLDTIPNSLARSGSILIGRPISPTKGLGGFVESAMMKRSDSINKRWSVQANTGLKRGDSTAGMRPLSGIRSVHASSLSKTPDRDQSPTPLIPSSTKLEEDEVVERVAPESKDRTSETETILKQHGAGSDPANLVSRPKTPPEDRLSRSPSKSIDNKRWSPTKSSWLESALLSKPEMVKPQPVKEDVPVWRANLQRNKLSRDLSPEKQTMTNDAISNGKSQILETSGQALQGEKMLDPIKSPKPDSTKPESLHQTEDSGNQTDMLVNRSERVSVTNNVVFNGETSTGTLDGKISKNSIDKQPQGDKKLPPATKPKPRTPPKTDFRSTLRTRAPSPSKDTDAEPEFRSMFGKLKHTETSNYVAPDVLKHNIVSGKAALNITSGPQKSQRADDFKESILQKKEAMKSGPGPKASPTSKPEAVVPEALARHKMLQNLTSSPGKTRNLPQHKAEVQSETIKSLTAVKPMLTVKPKSLALTLSNKQEDESQATGLFSKSQTVASVLPQKTTTMNTKISKAVNSFPTPNPNQVLESKAADSKATPATTPVKNELPSNSKLASRLNPNLASFLVRGAASETGSAKTGEPDDVVQISTVRQTEPPKKDDVEDSSELTHMTKGRAKGPKRRAPKSQGVKASSPELPQPTDARSSSHSLPTVITSASTTAAAEPSGSFAKTTVAPTKPEQIAFPSYIKSTVPTKQIKPIEKEMTTSTTEVTSKPKPVIAAKPADFRKVSGIVSEQTPRMDLKTTATGQFKIASDSNAVSALSAKPTDRDVPLTPKPSAVSSPLMPNKSRVNTPKPAQVSMDAPLKAQSPKPVIDLGMSISPMQSKSNTDCSPRTPQPDRPRKPSSKVNLESRSMVDSKVSEIVSAYFPKLLEKRQAATYDAPELLQRAVAPIEKVQSISHSINEITNDGKRQAVLPDQEHILYEDSMYIISHSFELHSGSKLSEVYLWCGDDVNDATIEDAQVFCRKDAREHNSKLEVIRQGKEPARFFQALGGILITRRNKVSSLYMLRGRRHEGHIAFDEVDHSPASLCSGFVYLISAKFGKLYLWKGTGSGADEIGGARLIGMDLGLTGDLVEVTEGEEPTTFWDAFPQSQNSRRTKPWSSNWQKRAQHDCYPTRLYRVDMDRPKSAGGFWGLRSASPSKPSNKIAVEPIAPFCGRDLDASNVYILDTYWAIYVILHPQATNKGSEIVTAMYLSQELAMLAPSIQDRSLIPACHVVFGDLPDDVKLCFRTWSESEMIKSDKPSACLPLEDVMEALKL